MAHDGRMEVAAMLKKCANCGREFETNRSNKKYCAAICRHRAGVKRDYQKNRDKILARKARRAREAKQNADGQIRGVRDGTGTGAQ